MTSQTTATLGIPVRLKGRGGELPAQVLYVHKEPALSIEVVVTADSMRAFARLAFTGTQRPKITREFLRAVVKEAGITVGAMDEGLALFASICNRNPPFAGYFQIARGTPMHTGEDGAIEFFVQPTAAQPRYDQTDSGGIDFKQLNLIENCFAGQQVASIVPPGPGRAGTDIFGHSIPPVPGKPVSALPGPGVILNANGKDFTAEIEGRLVHENNSISVSPVLEIAHDVDYSVGNIDFVGRVEVQGSVLDGFTVNGKKGVKVSGEVGSAVIQSSGPVEIHGGIVGRNNCRIACSSLKARYINSAVVETTDDVMVEKEILHSNVKSLGRVTIPRGYIIGGEVWAFRGIEAEGAGSEMGVATKLAAGLNWDDETKAEQLRLRMAEYGERIQASSVLIAPVAEATAELSATMTVENRSMVADLIAELRNIRSELADIMEERKRVLDRRQEGLVCQINILKEVFPGVQVRFTACQGSIRDALKGPLSIVQEERKERYRIVGYIPLTKAEDMSPEKLSQAKDVAPPSTDTVRIPKAT